MSTIPIDTLVGLCQLRLIEFLAEEKYSSRLVNFLCKHLPMILLDPVLTEVVRRNPACITDSALLAFLVPTRIALDLQKSTHLRNSTLKQIGYNCRELRTLNLSDCVQVCNSVVRVILVECGALEELRLDRCVKVTDSAFDMTQSPFELLVGCLSLRAISLEGCPQVSGQIVHSLNSACRNLKHLNLSQCKQIQSVAIQEIFDHNQLRILNLSFIGEVSDVAFSRLPKILSERSHSSPLENLNLGNSKITDETMFRMACLGSLLEIRLQFCSGLTDMGIIALAGHCKQLRSIDLKSCAVSSVGVEALAVSCSELRRLDLSWCGNISDSAIGSLADKCVHLDTLLLVWCSQLTDAALLSLLTLPSLRIVEVQGCVHMRASTVDLLRAGGDVSVVH